MVKLIRTNLKGYGFITVLGPVLKFLEAVVELMIPLAVANIVDVGIKQRGDINYVLGRGAFMLAFYVVGFIFSTICQKCAAISAYGFGTNLRRSLYGHINSLPLEDAERIGAPTLLTRINHDVVNVQNTLNRFIRLVTRSPFIIVGALIMSVMINPTLSLAFFGAAALLSLSLYLVMKNSAKKLKQINIKHDEISTLTKENLSGARVVRAFNKQAEEEVRFKKTSDSLKKHSIALGLLTALSSPLTYLIVNSAMIIMVYAGAFEVQSGDLEQGQIIALINYLTQILNSMLVMALLVNFFAKGQASSKRINNILAIKPENKNGDPLSDETQAAAASKSETEQDNVLVFRDVSFKYGINSGYSLKNVSFTLKRGQTLGVIGSTGSGKTTLISLIAKLYEYEGHIELFGKDLSKISAKSVRDTVSIAPQKCVLFSGTVRDNLLMANPDASDEDISAALNAAQCGFISSPDAVVARGGANFSGGQRQRLCIARTLIKKSRLIIFDDSTSALDYTTEAAVKREMNKLTDSTKIIVTQRVGGIKNADLILVLEDGAPTGLGTHAQLLDNCPIYREINDIQEATV